LSGGDWTTAGLWFAVVASGVYHGVNPGMGWPLAVSAGMIERRTGALFSALGFIGAGHLLAMTAALLPFALLASMLAWRRLIQIAAAILVSGFGLYLLVWPRHPRLLARIPPAQLGLWSFAVAVAHGAGLMLVPIYLGLCQTNLNGETAVAALVDGDVANALLVALVHALAMIAAGGAMAWLIYRYLGLEYVSRTWLNLDKVWAASLILAGGASLGLIAVGAH
jgi:hypothetical protein